MVSGQWSLPTTRGSLRGGPPKLSRRERVLVSLVFVLGAAVWFLALVGPGHSAPKGPTLPKKTTQLTQAADLLATVEPRRLADASGLENQGSMQAPDTPAMHAPGQTDERTLTTDTVDLPLPQKPQTPDVRNTDSQSLRSPDTHTQSWLNSLKDVNSEVQNAFDVPNPKDQLPLPESHENAKIVWPKTVAELVEDVRANGAPSSRPGSSQGFHFYPVKEEYNLTTLEFTRKYGHTYASQPVKIKNSQSDWWKAEDWTLEAVREQVGDISVFRDKPKCKPGKKNRSEKNCHRVKEKDPAMIGISWAAMMSVDVDKEGIETYNDLFDKQIALAKDGRYLYAQEVGPRWLLDFVQRLRQPKYFMNNIVDVDRENHPDPLQTLSDNIFPAFFFGPEGSQSPLHTDASMTRFWILELTGTKLIRLVPPNNNWRLDATDDDDFQPELFTADILVPDFEKHPNLDGLIVYETLLEPGDLLYIPEGWAHQALNLDWTCMTSYNYNDDQNLPNRLTYYGYDKPDELFDTEMMSNHFFYPLVNMSTDIGNTEILEFIRMHTLEYAPVSDAARNHIEKLKAMGMKPEEWRDFYSRPVLQVAVAYNYLALAKWLVEEGVVLQNDTEGRTWLKTVEHQFQLRAMSEWMRDHMGIDPSDDISDVDLQKADAFK